MTIILTIKSNSHNKECTRIYNLIEKLSFQLPYQVTRFESKEQLNDYLMGMYDTEWGQDTAKPFIMENTKLMKEYHAVSDR